MAQMLISVALAGQEMAMQMNEAFGLSSILGGHGSDADSWEVTRIPLHG